MRQTHIKEHKETVSYSDGLTWSSPLYHCYSPGYRIIIRGLASLHVVLDKVNAIAQTLQSLRTGQSLLGFQAESNSTRTGV